MTKHIFHYSFLFLGITASVQGHCFDWTSTNIQLLHGRDFELGDPDRTTVTIEHANGWQYGSNFFFVDLYDNIGLEVYAEAYGYLSLSKLSGTKIGFGPIQDMSIVGGLNISNKPENDNFKAYMAGLSLDFANPYFDYLQLDAVIFKDDGNSGRYGYQFTPVWSLPFEISPVKFKFRGFTDFRSANTNVNHHFNILAQPQLLIDIGDLSGLPANHFYIGTEYSYWYNKYGIQGLDESVVQGMMIAFF